MGRINIYRPTDGVELYDLAMTLRHADSMDIRAMTEMSDGRFVSAQGRQIKVGALDYYCVIKARKPLMTLISLIKCVGLEFGGEK